MPSDLPMSRSSAWQRLHEEEESLYTRLRNALRGCGLPEDTIEACLRERRANPPLSNHKPLMWRPEDGPPPPLPSELRLLKTNLNTVAVDAEFVVHPTLRHFLSCIALQCGKPFRINPRVISEAIDGLRRTQAFCWYQSAKLTKIKLSKNDLGEFWQCVDNAALLGASRYLISGHGAVLPVGKDKGSCMDSVMLHNLLPDSFFTDSSLAQRYANQAKVCDALASSSSMFMTQDSATIDHANLNLWLSQSGLRQSNFVVTPDQALQHLLGDGIEEIAQMAVLAMLHLNVRPNDDSRRQLLDQFVTDLQETFPSLSETLADAVSDSKTSKHRRKSIKELNATAERQSAKRAEEEMVLVVQNALRDLGFVVDLKYYNERSAFR